MSERRTFSSGEYYPGKEGDVFIPPSDEYDLHREIGERPASSPGSTPVREDGAKLETQSTAPSSSAGGEVVVGELMPEEPELPRLPEIFKDRVRFFSFKEMTVDMIETFLRSLEETGLIARSALQADIPVGTIRRLRKEDEIFAKLYEDALTYYKDSLERECHRRAVEGWDEPVFSQKLGTQIGMIRKYDQRLLELMLKRHIPEYREKFEGEIRVSGGVLVAPIAAQSAEQWAQQHGGEKLQLLEDQKTT